MGKLIYALATSLDGYVADEQGKFDWAKPDEQVHAFINDLERSAGTYLYGRRMYETMVAWETMDDPEPLMRDYAQSHWYGVSTTAEFKAAAQAMTSTDLTSFWSRHRIVG